MKIPIRLLGEYAVRVVDMPCRIRSFVTFDNDDFASIYVNARLSHAEQEDAVRHEIAHIIHNDIHNADSIRTVERRAAG